MYIFSNILGIFVFDEQFNVIDKLSFNNLEDYQNKEKFIGEIKNKYKNLKEPDEGTLKKILLYFKDKKFIHDFYNKNTQLTKFDIKNSVNTNALLIQAINSIDELDKVVNILVKRLREWYELYNPEFSKATGTHEEFVDEILTKEKNELLKEMSINANDSIGADLRQEDIVMVRNLSHQIHNLYQLRKDILDYASALMDELCPNTKAICGVLTGARLIGHAGSLKRLSEMPASKIQILGAETALFRHIKTGSKPPKHGIIANHPLITEAPDKNRGKIARALSDKISIASKVDYFNGQFIGDKLKKELEAKFGKVDGKNPTIKNI